MKLSKQILRIVSILFLMIAFGCSKSLLERDDAEFEPRIFGMDDSLEYIEEDVGEEEILAGLYEKPSPRDFGAAERGMPGDGYTGSFIAEPFSARDDEEKIPARPEPILPEEEPFLPEAEPFLPGNGEDKEKDKGEEIVASLPKEEEVRLRFLPYRSFDLLKEIYFKFDKYDLDDKSRAILESNAAYLKARPILQIEIQGHCDERGTNNYNISLGERRAQSTKSYLVSLGIDENRIRTISYGEERPFCFENNELCWYQNRRAHILVATPYQSQVNHNRF